jgi:flavin reductase (DIM6/NTAB) family NADH-FMN oxidoreductase RutF
MNKRSLPVTKTRRYLEPGPIVLISSHYKNERNIMTLGWHMMLEYDLVGCFIWDQNHSRNLIRKSKQCIINIPTYDMIDKVIQIGNTHAAKDDKLDKFARFKLTPTPAKKVNVPMIAECPVNIECQLIDTTQIKKYSLFIFQVLHLHAATTPKYPQTVHYRGEGIFMISGPSKSYRSQFKKVNL